MSGLKPNAAISDQALPPAVEQEYHSKDIDENLKKIITHFPRLFREQPPKIDSYVSTGWYELVFCLFDEIDKYLTDEQAKLFRVIQIKEKFGILRVYVSSERNADGEPSLHISAMKFIYDAVARAEQLSAVTCEVCGAEGYIVKSGWLRTLCNKHRL